MERWEELIEQASEREVKDFLIETIKRSPGLADSVIIEFCDEEDLDKELINKIYNNYRKLYEHYLALDSNRTKEQARAYSQRLDVLIITDINPLISKGLIDGAFKITREIFESNSERFPVTTAFGYLESVQNTIQNLIVTLLDNADAKQREEIYKWLLEQKTVDNSYFKKQFIESILDQFIDSKLD